MGAVIIWHGFCKERVKANAKRCERDRHQKSDQNDGDDLLCGSKEKRDKDEEEKANAVVNRRPEDGLTGVAFRKPASGRDGEEEIDHGRHGSDQADLQTCCAETCGVDN
jgi:hypothetical protein